MKSRWIFQVLLPLAATNGLHAQRMLQAVTPTALYAAPTYKARTLGMFTRGGVVFHPRPAVDVGWLQIEAEDGTTGFVQKEYFRATLNAADIFAPDPPPFIPGNDGYMGCPHLFVRAVSIKGRTAPRADARAGKIFHTNDPVCIGYLPHEPDGWVRVEGHYADDALYVQRKFLGPRLRPDSVLRGLRRASQIRPRRAPAVGQAACGIGVEGAGSHTHRRPRKIHCSCGRKWRCIRAARRAL